MADIISYKPVSWQVAGMRQSARQLWAEAALVGAYAFADCKWQLQFAKGIWYNAPDNRMKGM